MAITSGLGKGFPDIVVGRRVPLQWLANIYGRQIPFNFMLEIKDGAKTPFEQRLTADEARFHEDWPGQIAVVKNLGDALRKIGAMP